MYPHHVLQFDADKNGHITASEIKNVLKALGEDTPGYKIRDMIREVDIDENGTVEFNEFLKVIDHVLTLTGNDTDIRCTRRLRVRRKVLN